MSCQSQYTLCVKQGEDLRLRLRLSSEVLNFAEATVEGQIRATYSSAEPLAEFTCELAQDVNGYYVDVSLTAAETSDIAVKAATSYIINPTMYCYDIELTLAPVEPETDGRVIRLLYGPCSVMPEVTKPVETTP